MKVIIVIDKDGYTKTISKGKKKFTEIWERNSHGFSQETSNLEDASLLSETIEALEGLDFELQDISNALETETAEIDNYDVEPMTDDGHLLKRGETFYTVACRSEKGKLTYMPLRLKYPQDWGSHGSRAFISRDKCLVVCDEQNSNGQATKGQQ